MSLIDQWFTEEVATLTLDAIRLSSPELWAIESKQSSYRTSYVLSPNNPINPGGGTPIVALNFKQHRTPRFEFPNLSMEWYETGPALSVKQIWTGISEEGGSGVASDYFQNVRIIYPHFMVPNYTLVVNLASDPSTPQTIQQTLQQLSLTLEFNPLPGGVGNSVGFVGQSGGTASTAFQWICNGLISGPAP